MKPRRCFRRDQRAVSDTIDTTIMVGITVLAGATLVALITSMGGPAERVNSDLRLSLDPGQGEWGTGDELLLVHHAGGEAILTDQVSMRVTIDGAMTEYSGAALGFTDDRFAFGDTWSRTFNIPVGAAVSLDIVAETRAESAQGAPGVNGAEIIGGGYLEELIFSGSITAIGAAPDLAATILGTDPATPYTGGPDMTIRVQVTNNGNEAIPAGLPIEVLFDISGTILGTTTYSGGLGVGDSVVLVSPTWDILAYDPATPWSQVGIYLATATVDPSDLIPESNEADNVDTLLFQVAPGIYDPGFPYEDFNNDGLYTPGSDDFGLINGEVQDGHHVTPVGIGLVIPPSTGDIDNVNLYQTFSDSHIIIAVNLTATTGQIHIKTTEGSIFLDGITITTGGSIKIEMTQSLTGTDLISIVGSTLSAGTYIDIDAKDGYVLLTESDFTSGTSFTVLANGGIMDADAATVTSSADILLEAKGDVSLLGTKLTAATTITADLFSATRTIYVQDAEFDDANDTLLVDPDGVTVVGSPARGTVQ